MELVNVSSSPFSCVELPLSGVTGSNPLKVKTLFQKSIQYCVPLSVEDSTVVSSEGWEELSTPEIVVASVLELSSPEPSTSENF